MKDRLLSLTAKHKTQVESSSEYKATEQYWEKIRTSLTACLKGINTNISPDELGRHIGEQIPELELNPNIIPNYRGPQEKPLKDRLKIGSLLSPFYADESEILRFNDEPSIFKLREVEKKMLNEAVETVFDDSMKAIYFYPAWTPTANFPFRKKGTWTYLDKDQLDGEGYEELTQRAFFDVNPRTSFITHGVRNTDIPPGLEESSFDLFVFIKDWPNNGATPQLAVKLCKPGGIIVTTDAVAEGVKGQPGFLEQVGDAVEHIATYRFAGYSIFRKK